MTHTTNLPTRNPEGLRHLEADLKRARKALTLERDPVVRVILEADVKFLEDWIARAKARG